jgi:hypothetical protein
MKIEVNKRQFKITQAGGLIRDYFESSEAAQMKRATMPKNKERS